MTSSLLPPPYPAPPVAQASACRVGTHAGTLFALAALLLISTALAPAQVAEKANAHYATPEQRSALARGMSDPSRDQEEKPRELIASLSISAGMAVADIGTGPGYMLPFLSGAVGPRGRVLAEDIFPDFLDVARRRAETAHLANVTLVLGTQTDPKLPAASLDLAFLLDVYHHFNYPAQMLARLRDSLREGGRLAIVDYYRRPGAMPSNDALEHIRIDQPDVIKEVEAGGFHLLSKHDHIPNSQYVLIFRKSN
ncbi:MAG TPA: methyltransferase domain-containing protein [Bryobacteraceae bacterium]|nr:methyltransferase domain-containing protein [Bryobacteraceae bacterium]